ncbi:MAG: hypothetical protein Q8L29_03070, partial [archaeon]|nr:hypothetical protein [archaeon]
LTNRFERQDVAKHRIESMRDVLRAIYRHPLDYFVVDSGEEGVRFVYPSNFPEIIGNVVARIDSKTNGSISNPIVTIFYNNFSEKNVRLASKFKHDVLDRERILCGIDICSAAEYLCCLKDIAF